jgi:NADH-quinone oxidoreductase subunit J
MTLGAIYFYACALLAIAGALAVVISKNPIRSAMGLLLLILSFAGQFIGLNAQFLAAIQLIVYAGAIVVLFLFVIMLLGPNAATETDQRGLVVRVFGGGLFALAGLGTLGMVARVMIANGRKMPLLPAAPSFGGIDAFGSVMFSDAVVPFELSSGLLMVAVVGALAVARGRQGVHSLSRDERGSVEGMPPDLPDPQHSGVFSHEIHLGETGATHKTKEHAS